MPKYGTVSQVLLQMVGALQQLYPLELACDRDTGGSKSQLNPDAEAFTPKQTRRAAQEARDRIAAVAADAEEDFEQSLC